MSAGGIRGRTEATGRGVFYGVREAVQRRGGHEGAGAVPGTRGQAGRGPGAGQRRLPRRQVLPGGRRDPGRASPSARAPSPTRRGSTSRRSWRTAASGELDPRLPGRHQPRPARGGARAGLRHPDPRGPRAADHRRERPAHPGQDHRRGRQRPHDPRGRRDPAPARHHGDPRRLPQRGRRHRLLLRVGQEPRPRPVRPDAEALRGGRRPSGCSRRSRA